MLPIIWLTTLFPPPPTPMTLNDTSALNARTQSPNTTSSPKSSFPRCHFTHLQLWLLTPKLRIGSSWSLPSSSKTNHNQAEVITWNWRHRSPHLATKFFLSKIPTAGSRSAYANDGVQKDERKTGDRCDISGIYSRHETGHIFQVDGHFQARPGW